MSLSADQVKQVAHLARLEIKDEQVNQYADQLSRILHMVDQLQQADTQSTDPMAHPLSMVQRLRPDEVTQTDQRKYFPEIAPAVEEGLFLVPKVIE